MSGHGAFKFKERPNDFRNIAHYRETFARRASTVYRAGDRVRWVQRPNEDRPALATVILVKDDSVVVEFDEVQREFGMRRVLLDRQAIEPEESSDDDHAAPDA